VEEVEFSHYNQWPTMDFQTTHIENRGNLSIIEQEQY